MNANVTKKIANSVSDEEENFMAIGKQYLTFILGGESYAVDILSVKEIRGWETATLVPNSPHYLKGVVNMRGTIVPIADLRICFNVGEPSCLPTTVVIILSGKIEGNSKTVGFIVDAVSDVIDVKNSDIKSAPEFDGTVPADYVHGLVNTNENVVTVLDVEQLLSMDN